MPFPGLYSCCSHRTMITENAAIGENRRYRCEGFLTKARNCATLPLMRILHLVHQYPPDHVGGVEQYTRATATALGERGHTVGVCYRQDAPGAGWAERAAGAVQLYPVWDGVRTPAQRFAATFGARRLTESIAAVLDRFQPDLVHIQHLLGLPLALRQLLVHRRLPYVITLHDYWWVCVNANLRTNYDQSNCAGPQRHLNCTRCVLARAGSWTALPLAPAVWAGLTWRAGQAQQWLHGARLLLAPSAFVRAWHLQQGAPADRCQVLALGVTAPPAAATSPAHEPHALRFLYLGSIAPIKGVHVIVEAFRAVTGPAELWIAGDATADPAYTAHLQALAGKNVRFLGRLDRAGVWQVLADCDLVLTPSLVPETFCMVNHEAFAAGKPVFAARIGALATNVTDGQDGRLLEPGNVEAWRAAMQRAVDVPAERAQWRAHIKPPLTVDEHVDQLIDYYQQALQ
jgi:glycosyltransferase involved in cell wall biosynthesis